MPNKYIFIFDNTRDFNRNQKNFSLNSIIVSNTKQYVYENILKYPNYIYIYI